MLIRSSPSSRLIGLSIVCLVLLYSSFAFSRSASADPSLDWFTMFMWLAGGLALFLYGIEKIVKGLMVVAGDKMKSMLAKLTSNRVMGAATGAGFTAVIQSSFATSMLVVGFVSAGLMTVGQAAGIIMGANLGATMIAHIVAFKIAHFGLLMIAVGFIIQYTAKLRKKKAFGDFVMGLGLIFFGMSIMSQGMEPLKTYQPFLELMVEMQNPLLAIVFGLVITMLVHSSSATIAIVIVLASNGLLTLPAGIALVLGADIGTSLTVLLATIGKSRDALRTAMIHVKFNVFAVLIWLPFIPELSALATYITSSGGSEVTTVSEMSGALSGEVMAVLAENTPREIANANTLFKFTALLLFLPMIPIFLWGVYKIFPVREDEKIMGEFKPKFLDKTLLDTPTLSFSAVNLELEQYQKQMGLFYKRLITMIAKPNIDRLSREDMTLQLLRTYHSQILSYLGQAGQLEFSEEEQLEHMKLMNVVSNLESMLEAIHSDLQQVLHEMIQENIKPSETMLNLVGQLTSEVGKALDNALRSIYQQDSEAALSVLAIEQTIDHLIQEALSHQVRRFKPDAERLKIFRYEMQLVNGLKQLHTFSKRIARLQLANQETADSRLIAAKEIS